MTRSMVRTYSGSPQVQLDAALLAHSTQKDAILPCPMLVLQKRLMPVSSLIRIYEGITPDVSITAATES